MNAVRLLFGRPLASAEDEGERIGPVKAVAVLGLGVLASTAYGPEAILTALLPGGAPATRVIVPIIVAIIFLLAIVSLSYGQAISAYPDGGGSYTVAKRNLGTSAGLLAASALALDYVLNVAVGIAAGIGAVVSVVPSLLPYTLPLCLVLLAFMTLINLRGVRTTGLALMAPTYLFIAALVGVMAIGGGKAIAAGGRPLPLGTMPALGPGTATLGWWLVLRAFANGCTAITGVEAVSNAVPIFRDPAIAQARRTLAIIIVLLVALLAGEALLCRAYGVAATPPGAPGFESVLSQLVRAIIGRGWLYVVTMAAVFAVLCLSANTSFAAFPQLCRLLALDEHMPPAFAHRGRRLVYSNAIVLLAVIAGGFLVGFGGVTDRLIPVFAIGAFVAYTLSQLGMAVHWWRARGRPGVRRAMAINVIGAAATGAVTIVVVVSKLTDGAWVSLLVIATLLVGFRAVRAHFRRVDAAVGAIDPVSFADSTPPTVIVPLRRLDRTSANALAFGARLSTDVQAVQFLTEAPDEPADLTAGWRDAVEAPALAAGRPAPKLIVIRSKYRDLLAPLVAHVRRISAVRPDRYIAVVIPELIEPRWYQRALHSQQAPLLKSSLLRHGVPNLVVVTVPWQLDRPRRRGRQ